MIDAAKKEGFRSRYVSAVAPGGRGPAALPDPREASARPLDNSAAAATSGLRMQAQRQCIQAIFGEAMPQQRVPSQGADVIQRVEIKLKKGTIKLPRIYQNPIEQDQYVVTDFASEDIDYYIEVNRMCNVMSILWAKRQGQPGNIGFWDFDVEDQKLMANWAAADTTVSAQTSRAETELGGTSVDLDTLAVILQGFEDRASASGVLASADHAVAFVIAEGQISIYDPMNGEVTYRASVSAFVSGFAVLRSVYEWSTCVMRS